MLFKCESQGKLFLKASRGEGVPPQSVCRWEEKLPIVPCLSPQQIPTPRSWHPVRIQLSSVSLVTTGIPDQKREVVLGNIRSQFDCGSPELVEEQSCASVDGLRRSILSVRVGTVHLVQVLERRIRQRSRRYALLKSDSIP